MARRKSRKSAVKKAGKELAKNKTAMTVIAIILVIAIIAGLCWYFFIYKKQQPATPATPPAGTTENQPEAGTPQTPPVSGTVQTGDLSIHFLELGVKNTGDCTLIKYGDTEILIDAGAKQESAETIVPYIKNYCTDGILEYVIATHAHQDHIGAFYSTKNRKGVFESFDCRTIIDFAKTDKSYSAASVYGRYTDARDAEVEAGAVHYTALQCWNETDGAKRSYEIGENVTMNILYQKYYEEKSSSGENDYSVCMLLTQGEYHYLFTGDLEKDGEASLVEKNDLPHCKVFKGGHHGSSTSTTETLLNAITPEIICICTCAGTPEYAKTNPAAFPTQECINRMAKYTEKIYVTSLATDVNWTDQSWSGIASMNGNIVVTSDGIDLKVKCSNNDIILKDTEWFKANRTWPSS